MEPVEEAAVVTLGDLLVRIRSGLSEALATMDDKGSPASDDSEPYWLSPLVVETLVSAARAYLALLDGDAIVVQRGQGRHWPAWVRDAFNPGPKGYTSQRWDVILHRLASAAVSRSFPPAGGVS